MGFGKVKKEGLLEGKREALLRWLTRKFGDLPEEIIQRIQGMDDDKSLDTLVERVLDARNVEEMEIVK